MKDVIYLNNFLKSTKTILFIMNEEKNISSDEEKMNNFVNLVFDTNTHELVAKKTSEAVDKDSIVVDQMYRDGFF